MKSVCRSLPALLLAMSLLLAACGQAATPAAPVAESTTAPTVPTAEPVAEGTADEKLVVYSGRSESLVGPLFETFKQDTGIDVQVRYGDTAELAALILEEGDNSPADLFFAQDAGALGALSEAERFIELPKETLDKVPVRFRSENGQWVGVSGRARVVVYNTTTLSEADLPASITGFVDPKWKGKIGWAPTNGSFQAFVTAFRVQAGEEAAKLWLEGILANEPRTYDRNAAVVQAVADGEIEVGFVNHYYLYQFLKDKGESFPARNFYPTAGDVGALINVAGVGILNTAKQAATAQRLVDYLLDTSAQQYFADQTVEYPLIPNIKTNSMLKPLDEIQPPDVDLSKLSDLKGTLVLLEDVGALK